MADLSSARLSQLPTPVKTVISLALVILGIATRI